MLALTAMAALDVAAASGLVVRDGSLWVVADDELFLARYALPTAPTAALARVGSVALFDGELPVEHADRKRHKPDLEALAALPDGRLLALGSGSKKRRKRAAVVDGERIAIVDLAPLYDVLERRLPDLNIEGATVHAGRLWLAQRGNGKDGRNALVALDLPAVLEGLARGVLTVDALAEVVPVDLGTRAGERLTLSDLTSDGSSLWFSAAAEPSGSTYDDAPCVGSVVGRFAADGSVAAVDPIDRVCKLEGLAFADGYLWLVADADDRARPAPLFRAEAPAVTTHR